MVVECLKAGKHVFVEKPLCLSLDVCALCRPYDDQSYARINLETIAVHLILKTLEAGRYTMISSPAHKIEISAISDDLERIDLLLLLEKKEDLK